MSNFRFGLDDYGLSYYPSDASDGMGGVEWDEVERVEIEGVVFVREGLQGGTCEIKQHRCTSCDHEINDDAYYVRVNLGNGAWTAESRHANFCPNCGARIRKQVGE